MSKKTRRPIEMTADEQCGFKDVFDLFAAAKTAKGVEKVTIGSYYYRLSTGTTKTGIHIFTNATM